MNKCTSLAAALVLGLLSPVNMYAAPACTRAIYVTEPCAGLLVPTEDANTAQACVRHGLPDCLLGLKRQQQDSAVDASYAAKLLQIERLRADRLDALLATTLLCPKPEVPAWHSSRVLWFGVGFAAGGGLFYAAARAMR